MSENITNLKETDMQPHEIQRILNKAKYNRHTVKHIVVKMAKGKERLLKVKRKTVIYKETPIKLAADFLAKAFEARREWYGIVKVIKGRKENLFNKQSWNNWTFTRIK